MTAALTPLLEALTGVEIPTLGHFLEEGFCGPGIAPVGRVGRLAGPARTLDLSVPDAVAVNRALLALTPGDVLVIRVHGGAHAPVGAVTAAAALAQGAAGIVVAGPVTDRHELERLAQALPVYSAGFAQRTTKLTGELEHALDVPITVGDATVRPGDLILGDEHGILVLPPEGPPAGVLDRALASDAAEPALIERITSGEPLAQILALRAATPLTPNAD